MTLSLIHEEDALERFALKSNTFSFDSWQYDSYLKGRNLVLCEGDLTLPAKLDLDWEQWNENNILMALNSHSNQESDLTPESFAQTVGLIVDGNLIVDGAIVNASGDGGPLLLVMGDLKARHLVGGGAEIQIRGNANIEEVVWGHYNDGVLVVNGDANTPVLVNDDHHLEVRGNRNTEWEFDSDEDERDWDDEHESLPDKLLNLTNDYISSWSDLEPEVWSGNYVLARHDELQEERSYDDWLEIVSNNGTRLRSAPTSLKDEKMCNLALESNSDAIRFIPPELLSLTTCRKALEDNGAAIRNIPTELVSKELVEFAVSQSCDFFSIPEEYIDNDILKTFLLHNGSEINNVAEELGIQAVTPELAAAAIIGGASYRIPEEAINDETAFLVLGYGVEALDKLPGVFMTKTVYEKTTELFSSQADWSQIENSHRPQDQLSEESFLRTWQLFLDEEACLAVIEKGAKLVSLQSSLRSTKVCKAALRKNIDNFKWIPAEHLTEKMCLKAVKQDGLLLQYIPEELQSEEVVLEAVLEDGEALQYVSTKKRTVPICIAALIDDENAHKYVPIEQKEEVFSKAIEHFVDHDDNSSEFWLIRRAEFRFESGDFKAAIEDADKVLAGYSDAEAYLIRAKAHRELGDIEQAGLDGLAAITEDEDLLDEDEIGTDDVLWLKSITQSLVSSFDQEQWGSAIGERPMLLKFLPDNIDASGIINRAVQKHPGSIQYVSEEAMTPELWLIALEQDVVEFEDIPEDTLNEQHCLIHVEQWGSNLRDIPDRLRTEKVCRAALKTSASAMAHVPFDLQDKLEEAHLNSGVGEGDLNVRRIVMRALYEALFVKPTIHLPAEKGLFKYFGERPMVTSLTLGLASLIVMVLHIIVTVGVWQESGWLAGSLTAIGFWVAEIYWGWKEYLDSGVTPTFIMCLLIVALWPPMQWFFGRVNKLIKAAYGR